LNTIEEYVKKYAALGLMDELMYDKIKPETKIKKEFSE